MSKQIFIQRVQGTANIISQAAAYAQDLEDVYNSRLYGPGAANAITDAELTALGIEFTADQLYAFVIACSQLCKLMNNEAVTEGPYAVSVDHVRNDI